MLCVSLDCVLVHTWHADRVCAMWFPSQHHLIRLVQAEKMICIIFMCRLGELSLGSCGLRSEQATELDAELECVHYG